MKNVIVLGGTGFIGRRLAQKLSHTVGDNGQVVSLGSRDCDLVSQESTFAWFKKNRTKFDCNHIFHLAAVYKAGGWPAKHPATQFHANMAININVLEAWKRYYPNARFTSVVSYCMYPDHDRPHPESELYGTEPEPYLFAYAFTKKALLIGQEAYCKEFGLSATSCVLSTVYGPGDSFLESSHVMGALIGKFSRAAASRDAEVEVWGDGTQEREFLFVDDAVEGILDAAKNATSPILNLGVGKTYSIGELAEEIKKQTGFQGKICFNPNRFVGAKRRVLDVTRVRDELDWRPDTELSTGITATIESLRTMQASVA